MQGKLKKNPAPPELADLLHNLKEDIFRSLNCIKPGKIETFDQANKTATVQLLFKRIVNDKIISYPVLVDCPVFTLQGGGGSLAMPIQAGDPCLVLFADRNIDNWYSTGAPSAPANSRCHDIADGIVLVGINSLADSLAAYDDNVNLVVPATKKFVMSGGATAEILGDAALVIAGAVTIAVQNTLNDWISNVYDLHTHIETGGTTNVPGVLLTSVKGTTKLKGS